MMETWRNWPLRCRDIWNLCLRVKLKRKIERKIEGGSGLGRKMEKKKMFLGYLKGWVPCETRKILHYSMMYSRRGAIAYLDLKFSTFSAWDSVHILIADTHYFRLQKNSFFFILSLVKFSEHLKILKYIKIS